MVGMVDHACNPTYLGGEELEDYSSRPTQAKISETLISINKAARVVHRCNTRHR
jgi:hypothetical protein